MEKFKNDTFTEIIIVTAQRTIKLNDQKFTAILNDIKQNCRGIFGSDSELVGCIIFFIYLYFNEKLDNGKTREEIILDIIGKTREMGVMDIKHKYNQFCEGKYNLPTND